MVSSDGRWAVITSEISTLPRHAVHVIDLRHHVKGEWPVRAIVPDFEHDWKFVEGMGDRLWFITNAGAPHYRMTRLDLSRETPPGRR
jgi:prolyl oligopeptidase